MRGEPVPIHPTYDAFRVPDVDPSRRAGLLAGMARTAASSIAAGVVLIFHLHNEAND